MTQHQIHITEEEVSILQKLIGHKIYRLLSSGLSVENNKLWNTEFSLDYTNKQLDSIDFHPYIEIAADYNLTKETNLTYFQFEIKEVDTPKGVNRTNSNPLLWPFGVVKLWTEPIEKISIYQDRNTEADLVIFDRLILFKTKNEVFSLEATDSATGGITFTQTREVIETRLLELDLRREMINAT